MWTEALLWHGQEAFQATEFEEYRINGKIAGLMKNVKNFTVLQVFGAGHMVPMDQPAVSLAMINQFVTEKKLTGRPLLKLNDV